MSTNVYGVRKRSENELDELDELDELGLTQDELENLNAIINDLSN